MSAIWNAVKNNRLRSVLVGLGLVFIFVYNFIFPANPRGTDYLLLATRWIESSLWFSWIVSGFVLICSAGSLFYILVRDGKISTSLDKSKRGKRVLGIIVGAVVFVVLPTFLVSQVLWLNLPASYLTYVAGILALLIFLIDWLLEIDGVSTKLDLPIGAALALIILLTEIYGKVRTPQDIFVFGFVGGATAFQLILANILFDPAYYFADKLFPGKIPQQEEGLWTKR